MKKRKNQRQLEDISLQNPVAKFAHQFNKAQAYCDKTQYRRKAKHPKQEASSSIFTIRMFGQVSWLRSMALGFLTVMAGSGPAKAFGL